MSMGNSRKFWGNIVMFVIDIFYMPGRILPGPKILSSATPRNRTQHDKGWNLVCAQRG